jgi:hypothetical protein
MDSVLRMSDVEGGDMKGKIVIGLLVCLLMPHAHGWAEITYGELQHVYDKGKVSDDFSQDRYLVGVYEGIKATNLASLMQNKQPLFCKPDRLELNPRDIQSLVKDAHETYDYNGSIPVSYLLFIGLVKTFPCL